jgi:hypothetical protein
MDRDNPGGQCEDLSATTEELLVAVLARLCVLQGAADALVFAVSLLNNGDRYRGFSEWFARVHGWAMAARVGYLTEQYPQFRRLLDDHVQVGQRTTQEIFAELQAKFDIEQLRHE